MLSITINSNAISINMKLKLQSLSQATTEVEVLPEETVEVMRLKLVEAGKVSAESVVKLIHKGTVLDLNKKISEYQIVEGSQIVYLQTKKRMTDTKPETKTEEKSNPNSTNSTNPNSTNPTNPTNQQPVNQQTNSPVNSTAPHVEPLPATFNGVSMDMFRQFATMTVIGSVLSNPQLFQQILMQNPNMAMLRSSNPTEFDTIINHPSFLSVGVSPMQSDEDDQYDEASMFPIGPQNNFISPTGPTGEINGGQIDNGGPIRIILSQEDKQFVDEVRSMAPHVSLGEIVQYYIACNKDKNVTVDMVLSIQRDP